MNNGNDGNACWSQTCWHMFTNMVIIVNDVAAPFQPHVLLISNHPCSHENPQKPASNDAASAAAALKTLVDIEELSVPHCETMSVYSTSTPHDRSEGQAVLGPFWQSEHVSACAAQSVRVGSTHFHGRRHRCSSARRGSPCVTRFSASPKAGRDLSGRLLEFHRWISKLFSRARRSGAPRRRVSSQWAVIKLVRMDVEVVLLMHRVPRTTAKATCRCLHGHGKACCACQAFPGREQSLRLNLFAFAAFASNPRPTKPAGHHGLGT